MPFENAPFQIFVIAYEFSWSVHEDGMTDQTTAKVTIREEFEYLAKHGSGFLEIYNFVTEEIAHGRTRMRLEFRGHHVRSGGTMAVPSMMALADLPPMQP